MKKYFYAYFNTLGGFFGVPFPADHSKDEFLPCFNQSLYTASIDVLETLKEDDLYYLGYFDNVTGQFVSEKDFLCHLTDIVSDILSKKSKAEKVENHEC